MRWVLVQVQRLVRPAHFELLQRQRLSEARAAPACTVEAVRRTAFDGGLALREERHRARRSRFLSGNELRFRIQD